MILLTMIFLHIVDDYYLQGWLANAKQRAWWKENAPQEMYEYDYIWALLMHSFSWTFMIMLPLMFMRGANAIFVFMFAFNMLVHGFVDNLKCNEKKINLIQDQFIHIVQIIMTFVFVY